MADDKDLENDAVLKDTTTTPNTPIVAHSIGFSSFDMGSSKPKDEDAKDDEEPTATVDVRRPPPPRDDEGTKKP